MIKNNTAQIITLPPLPFLVHSLFAIDGWLLRGGVISCDCFLTIAGKAMIICYIFHKTSVMNDVWNLVMSRGREYYTQYSFDGRTDGLLTDWSHFDEAGSWCVTHRTQNPTRHPKRFQHRRLRVTFALTLKAPHTTTQPVYKAVMGNVIGKPKTSGPLRIPTHPLG